jgi:hypothetical protein
MRTTKETLSPLPVRLLTGQLQPTEIRRYVALKAVVFWGLIFLAWMTYPAENKYSIQTHTFSFLGSFEAYHNPQYWWLFTLAMVFWGSATIPMVIYIHRRFSTVSRWGARVGAFFFLAGCVGIVFVGLFPDAHGEVIAGWEWTDIHEKAAVLVAIGFILGIPWHGFLLLREALRKRDTPARIGHRGILWPYAFWTVIFCIAAYFQISWAVVYERMKVEAQAAGTPFGSSWSEGMKTWYSFPLWENVVIYSLFIFLVWFLIVLEQPDTDPGR